MSHAWSSTYHLIYLLRCAPNIYLTPKQLVGVRVPACTRHWSYIISGGGGRGEGWGGGRGGGRRWPRALVWCKHNDFGKNELIIAAIRPRDHAIESKTFIFVTKVKKQSNRWYIDIYYQGLTYVKRRTLLI